MQTYRIGAWLIRPNTRRPVLDETIKAGTFSEFDPVLDMEIKVETVTEIHWDPVSAADLFGAPFPTIGALHEVIMQVLRKEGQVKIEVHLHLPATLFGFNIFAY